MLREMEVIQTSASVMAYCNTFQVFQLPSRPRPCLHFTTTTNYPNCRRPSTLTKRKSFTRALLEDSVSVYLLVQESIATKVPEADLALTVKKRAMEIGPELKGTSVFLVGVNSSLKFRVGKVLADALRYYYFDSDSLVEEAVGGRSAAKSLLESDDKGFRDAETEVLKQLSSMGRLVVAAGNGSVQCATNLALLRHGISIWLDIPLDIVAKEVIDDKIQLPASEMSISGSYSEVLSQLTKLYKDRQSGYATADTTISLQKVASELGYDVLDSVTTEDIALEVLNELERLVRVKKMMEEAAMPF